MAAPAPVAVQRSSPPPPAAGTGQASPGAINPLGLFSITSNGTNTTAIQGQQFNPGDVPAPPVYGSGVGAPTDYTQTNFGGSVAPNMAATLNNPHPAILASPAPVTPAPATRPVTAPTSAPGSQFLTTAIRNKFGLNISPQEIMQPAVTPGFGHTSPVTSPYDAIPFNNKTPTYARVPNRALSKSSMTVTVSDLQFGNKL